MLAMFFFTAVGAEVIPLLWEYATVIDGFRSSEAEATPVHSVVGER